MLFNIFGKNLYHAFKLLFMRLPFLNDLELRTSTKCWIQEYSWMSWVWQVCIAIHDKSVFEVINFFKYKIHLKHIKHHLNIKRHCTQIWAKTHWDSTPMSKWEGFDWYSQLGRGTQSCYEAPGDVRVELERLQWLALGGWCCVFVSGSKLTFGQLNNWLKKKTVYFHCLFLFFKGF